MECNFAALKYPVFVNALFLKFPRRVEALGPALNLALLIWGFMERTMRLDLVATKFKITGWGRRQARRPTSLAITTKFIGVFIAVSAPGRRLSQTLSDIQTQYLNLPELTPDILITFYPN
jgi:hypothetical protein